MLRLNETKIAIFFVYQMLDTVVKLSLYAFSRKNNELHLRKWQKNLKIWPFGHKIWLPQLLDVMVSYHHVQYQKKTNDSIFTKLIDGWTDEQTDGQTDKSDFIGRGPTNVERPKNRN